jgi:hypothetical protein
LLEEIILNNQEFITDYFTSTTNNIFLKNLDTYGNKYYLMDDKEYQQLYEFIPRSF